MDMETVISRIRKPSRSASYDCRPRRLRAALRGCRPGAAGHDMRWNLSLKWRARSAVRCGCRPYSVHQMRCADPVYLMPTRGRSTRLRLLDAATSASTRYRLPVSPRRADVNNGEQIYAAAGQVIDLPEHRAERLGRDFLEWHLDQVFKAP